MVSIDENFMLHLSYQTGRLIFSLTCPFKRKCQKYCVNQKRQISWLSYIVPTNRLTTLVCNGFLHDILEVNCEANYLCQNMRDIFILGMITGDVDDDVDDPFCIKPSVIKPQENSSRPQGTITDTFNLFVK